MGEPDPKHQSQPPTGVFDLKRVQDALFLAEGTTDPEIKRHARECAISILRIPVVDEAERVERIEGAKSARDRADVAFYVGIGLLIGCILLAIALEGLGKSSPEMRAILGVGGGVGSIGGVGGAAMKMLGAGRKKL